MIITADARSVGLAHYAARGVLEHVLARHGLTFQQQLVLRTAVTADGPLAPSALVAAAHRSLKADLADLRTTVDELVARGLLAHDGAHVHPTHDGRQLLAVTVEETAPYSARIWGGIPDEDLAAAGRVLATVTERANAELARLTGTE